MKHVTLEVQGMSCGHCVAAVEAALRDVEGVEVESVSIGTASVRIDPEKATVGALIDAVADAGYTADEALT
jgi:copper chaperone CopZ